MAFSLAPVLSRFSLLLLCVALTPGVFAGAGQDAYEDYRERGLLMEGDVADYVSRVGQRVAAASGSTREFVFGVVDTGDVNAVAYADGHIFVFRGLLARLQTEGQLAAVLGHEVAHVTQRHVPKQQTRQRLSGIGAWLLGALLRNADLYYAAQEYSMAEISGYGREAELEADRFGAKYIGEAGYDPNEMYEVITILADESIFMREVYGRPPQYHGLFASHPRSDRRRFEMIQLGAGAVRDFDPEFEVGDLLEHIDGLAFGDLADEGVFRDQRFYHAGLGVVMDFPEGWRTSNGRTVKSATAPHGSQTTITVEVRPIGEEEEDLEAEAYLRQVLELAPSEGRPIVVDELPGYLAVMPRETAQTAGAAGASADGDGDTAAASAPAPRADTASRLVAVVLKDGFAYVFRGENRLERFERDFVAAFSRTVASFRRMRRDDLQAAVTTRIALVEAAPEDTYEVLARRAELGREGADVLRLLNGDFPNGQPRAGDRVKIIE
ncbi:MAG: M48 family metalloprotease [Pseudomonadales bacterium]|jgi:predicted Zn-dependent protease|nr:M48 family metalloprotease [Pseudomonadales bacterium]